jgi:pyridoxamine 5'-phosphate oxidase
MTTPHGMSIADLRKDYARESLDEKDVARDPVVQFARWFQEALNSGFTEPNAMSVATADPQGRPSARILLLKGYDSRGFVFFTNYESRKGRELAQNPYASLLFHWVELERQVRIEGRVEKVAPEESDEYYRSRPLGSRVGAWASPQSRVLADRAALENKLGQLAEQLGEDPPRPPHWGGYRLVPESLEFWQGRPSRLHDRVRYTLVSAGSWKIERLAP